MNAMYNRYIPQPDGSYRRNRMPDPGNQTKQPPPPPELELPPPKKAEYPPGPREKGPGSSFLSSLFPPGFDLGDLIVLLLLLLMAGDSREDRNTAILTMALYFIL